MYILANWHMSSKHTFFIGNGLVNNIYVAMMLIITETILWALCEGFSKLNGLKWEDPP